jgi:hypothetical protein
MVKETRTASSFFIFINYRHLISSLFQMVSSFFFFIVILTSIVHIVAQNITEPAIFDEVVDIS